MIISQFKIWILWWSTCSGRRFRAYLGDSSDVGEFYGYNILTLISKLCSVSSCYALNIALIRCCFSMFADHLAQLVASSSIWFGHKMFGLGFLSGLICSIYIFVRASSCGGCRISLRDWIYSVLYKLIFVLVCFVSFRDAGGALVVEVDWCRRFGYGWQ